MSKIRNTGIILNRILIPFLTGKFPTQNMNDLRNSNLWRFFEVANISGGQNKYDDFGLIVSL